LETLLIEQKAIEQEGVEEKFVMDNGVDWAPKSWIEAGDLKEMQGLFDKGVLKPTKSPSPTTRRISSKILRNIKEECDADTREKCERV
jgi:hypothetical protein